MCSFRVLPDLIRHLIKEVGTQRIALLGSDSVERVHTSFGYALFPLILMCQPISEKRVLQLDGVGHDIDEVFVLHRFS